MPLLAPYGCKDADCSAALIAIKAAHAAATGPPAAESRPEFEVGQYEELDGQPPSFQDLS